MPDQEADVWIRLPLTLEIALDINEIGVSVLTPPPGEAASMNMLVGSPGPYPDTQWLMRYSLLANHAAGVDGGPPHDIRLTAIEMVIAAEILDRAGRLLSEAIDVHLGRVTPDGDYYLGPDGISRASESYINKSLYNLAEPWTSSHSSADYVRFELLESGPGTWTGKLGIWVRRSALVGFIALAANTLNVSTVIGNFVKSHLQWEEQYRDTIEQELHGHQLEQIRRGIVKDLQENLDYLGFPPGAHDGKYGPNTERAIRDFEKAHHLPEWDYDNPALSEVVARAVVEKVRRG